MSDLKKLEVLSNEIKSCQKCKLHKNRLNTVFSRGNPEALVCFNGESPGKNEDEQGIPFVGKSGQLLDKAISELGYDKDNDIYICNPIKCRPPENRKPELEELQACYPYFERQLDLINAKVFVALGATAMSVLTDETDSITKLRGKLIKMRNGRLVVPVFHPSFILRQGGSKSEAYIKWKEDIKLVFDKAKEINETFRF